MNSVFEIWRQKVTKDSAEILRRLGEAGVEAIVVGMAAGILQGVPTTTRGLAI